MSQKRRRGFRRRAAVRNRPGLITSPKIARSVAFGLLSIKAGVCIYKCILWRFRRRIQPAVVYSVVGLAKGRGVAGQVLILFRCVFPVQDDVAVRKSTELLHDVGVKFRKLCHGLEGLPVRR